MKNLKFQSVFDIIGPVMVGPSSSHTAGAVRITKIVSAIFGETPTEVEFQLFNSFAKTYRGHGTDVAPVSYTHLDVYKRQLQPYSTVRRWDDEIEF